MISPDNPMDLALRLLAQGKGRKAEVIANSRGISSDELYAEAHRRRLYDIAAWKMIGSRKVGRRNP